MSEEEIIKHLKELLCWHRKYTPDNVCIFNNTDAEMLQGLLGLYYKQQTEIEEWQKAYIRENNYWLKFRNKINKIANNNKDCSDNAVIKAVKELKEKNASLQKEIKLMKSININENYISKNKIREKIKEYQNKLFQDIEENKVVEYENIIQVLEELLEE